MANLLESARRAAPFLAFAEPVGLFGALAVLRFAEPTLFCVQMNSTESICGPAYTHTAVRFLQVSGYFLWAALLAAAGIDMIRGKATRFASLAGVASPVLLTVVAAIWMTAPTDSGP